VKLPLPFEGTLNNGPQNGILFHQRVYLELVDFTGRAILPPKRGSIPEHQSPILQRLGLAKDEWLDLAKDFEKQYPNRHSRRAHLRKST
tara:strand:- start:140 stop:406 length:267 start_codon:yes stop_codon:yes gene_type:complete